MKKQSDIVTVVEEEASKLTDEVMTQLKERCVGIERIRIILPLPPRILSPNCPIASFRGRMMRAAAAKKQKRIAKESAEDAMRGERWQKASVKAVFYCKTKRRRDSLNFLSELKASIDGIVEAGLIPDDDSEHLLVDGAEFRIDKEWPRVELIFTRREHENK